MPPIDESGLTARLPPSAAPMHQDPEELEEICQTVVEGVAERLHAAGSVLVEHDGALVEGLEMQLHSVIKDVVDAAEVGPPSPLGDPLPPGSRDIGTRRAVDGIHPSESLWAAGVLFDVALPMLVAASPARRPAPLSLLTDGQIAQLLHRSIMRRVVPAAIGYVDQLLQRINRSHSEERRRIARELHDRIAHGIGVGLQGIQLHELDAATDPVRAATRLQRTQAALSEALRDVRTLAADLREMVSGRMLDAALIEYLGLAAPPGLRTSVNVRGDLVMLPDYVKEEVFVIVREAMRNSLLHADTAGYLKVVVTVLGRRLTVDVSDDGAGFNQAAVAERSLGLISMRERAELLDGTLEVESSPGGGTCVRLTVPLAFDQS